MTLFSALGGAGTPELCLRKSDPWVTKPLKTRNTRSLRRSARTVVLQQAQGHATKDAKIRVGVSLPNSRLVFAKCYIELPMQAILDRPVAADGIRELARRPLFAQDVIPHFARVLSIANCVIDRDADRREILPAATVRQVVRRRAHQVSA